ncbi:hypothetical protein VHUM_03942 [Vanrija humicola]|uniref:Major facilitator superfamily (MFS) profile domain-containing protein n=1 Tax=Vanrija humicola TaxID=5417 RepID=A0A7D8YVZ6_VANHU|nr:hypothetical protein VHUM_03942 [Vanrija humicola]
MLAFVGGRVGDQFGFKRVLVVGAAICWLALFAAAFSHNLAALIVTQGLLLGAGQGMIVPLFMSLPSQWFFKRRGLASGITLGGAGLGGGVSTLVVRRLLTAVGGEKTLLIYSFINLVFMALAIALIRTRPHSPEAQASRGPWINREVLSHSEFWAIALSLFVGVIGYGGPFVFLPQWMTLHFPDLSPGQVTVPLTIMGFTVCVGRSGVGLVADYIGPMNTYILVLVFSGVTQYALWLTARSFAAACVFGLMFGLVAPGYLGLLPQIVVTVFGPTALASNVGLLLLFAGPGMVVSASLGGAMFDATGRTDMKWMIVVMGGLQIFAGVLASWARIKASKVLWAKI